LPPIQERHAVNPRFSRLAVIGALAVAFVLPGCGRKGPLDPPPSAAVSQPQAAAPTRGMGFNPLAAGQEQTAPAAFDSEGRPVAPKGAKKRLPMDWLLD
jgi:predicted small lipoprotein YifL